jgi:hypothetical protein
MGLRVFDAGLLHRMLFEQFVGHEEHHAALVGGADGFDLGGLDGVGLVAEAVTDKGKHGGHFVVFEHAVTAHF